MSDKPKLIHNPKTFLLKQQLGTAHTDTESFELILVNLHTPGVTCQRTGKTYVLPWEKIIEMAVDMGVAEE